MATSPCQSPSLVVLYSTCYRNWEAALPSQLELLSRIAPKQSTVIVGAHYWTEKWGNDNHLKGTAPDAPPAALLAAYPNVIANHTPQPRGQCRVTYFMDSLRFAMENAEMMYRALYGRKMPDDQPILRMRPDVVITQVSEFPHVPRGRTGPYYISIWNSLHRPHFNPYHPEAGDIIAITTKGAIARLLSIDIPSANSVVYEPYRAKGRHIGFMEQYLYSLLEYAGVEIVPDHGIHMGIARQNRVEMMS